MFLPITKVDQKEKKIWLTAASEAVDKANEVMDYEKSKPNFQKWSEDTAKITNNKSYGNIREQHDAKKAIGKVAEPITFDDENKKVDIVVQVVDDSAWKKVEEGVLTGASIGGSYADRQYDSDLGGYRYVANISEISLVDQPCNPDATYKLIKTDGSTELRKFNNVKEIKMTKELLKEALPKLGEELSKVFVGTDSEKAERIRGALSNKIAVPLSQAGKDICFCLWVRDVFADKVIFEGKLDGDDDFDTYSIKYEITDDGIVSFTSEPIQVRTAYVEATDEDAVNAPVTVIKDAQKAEQTGDLSKADKKAEKEDGEDDDLDKTKDRKDVSEADEKRAKEKYGDVEFADEENKKYPLDTEEHVRAAASYFGMPKNKEKYSAEDQKKIEAKIKEAEKKFGIGEEDKKAEKAFTELELIKSGAKYSKETVEKLQKLHHDIAEMGGACKCEKCQKAYSNEDVEKSSKSEELQKVASKVDSLEKSVKGLEAEKEALLQKVADLEKQPDNSNAPAKFAVLDKAVGSQPLQEVKPVAMKKAEYGASPTKEQQQDLLKSAFAEAFGKPITFFNK